MNYKKLILVGFISAFVAILTSVLGVAGTIIGSVISSVLYNMLSEALENPLANATFDHTFEWDIAYAFPLVVIALIQLLLISALLAEAGFLPYAFLEFYMSIQNITENHLYQILGMALIVMSVYPLVLKPEHVKKIHGVILGFVGLVFLARGFVDMDSRIVDIYDGIFLHFDFQIAVIAFILLLIVIVRILISANNSEKKFRASKNKGNKRQTAAREVYSSRGKDDFDYYERRPKSHNVNHQHVNKPRHNGEKHNIRFKNHVDHSDKDSRINKSSEKIHFESNDLLDDYGRK
ncbi:hypothetical protein [Methanobrevibacter sp.]